ncbi:MAG: SIS domain-containing protein [Anaerolineaceae bacterium]
MDGIQTYFHTIQTLQEQVISSQHDVLCKVAEAMADTIAVDKRIFLFGTGHSHMLAEEGLYRAGGLACVVPVLASAFMLHENAALSSHLERTPGLARVTIDRYKPLAGEMILIFSNSGVNQLPIEMALTARELGMKVAGICSHAYAKIAPLSKLGKKLFEVSDYSIDNLGMPGDALLPVEGTHWKVAPSSTIINVLIWNCLLTETVNLLQKKKVQLPLIVSLNMPGAAEHNHVVLEKWRRVNPYL